MDRVEIEWAWQSYHEMVHDSDGGARLSSFAHSPAPFYVDYDAVSSFPGSFDPTSRWHSTQRQPPTHPLWTQRPLPAIERRDQRARQRNNVRAVGKALLSPFLPHLHDQFWPMTLRGEYLPSRYLSLWPIYHQQFVTWYTDHGSSVFLCLSDCPLLRFISQ